MMLIPQTWCFKTQLWVNSFLKSQEVHMSWNQNHVICLDCPFKIPSLNEGRAVAVCCSDWCTSIDSTCSSRTVCCSQQFMFHFISCHVSDWFYTSGWNEEERGSAQWNEKEHHVKLCVPGRWYIPSVWVTISFSLSLSLSPPQGKVAQTACMSACKHISTSLMQLLLDPEVRQISMGALHQLYTDVKECESEFSCSVC